MKKLVITSIIALLVAGWSIARAQEFPEEYLGLPGDNLNLYAVMKLFQESETLESFEKSLNGENSRINNLDLNGDNLVDYIMVYNYVDGDVHTIVLRTALSKKETQDIAVFTVQRFNDESVQIQLIGDEALYGKNYIIEPIYAESRETPNPGYIGNAVPSRNVTVVKTTTYEVAAWPVVRYIYSPSYVVWRSSWHWGYYPAYWSPWSPFYWHTYYGYHYHWHHHYYAHYRPWHYHRYPRYRTYYYASVRNYSPTVIVNINSGNYRTTYSRPDLRREGEVLYARNNAGRNSVQNSSVTRSRTSGATSVQRSSVSAGSATERRNSTAVTNRSATRSATEIRSDAARRAPAATTGRTITSPRVNPENDAVRKSAATPANRSSGSSNGIESTNSRRAPVAAPARTATRPSAGNNNEVNRKSATPAPTGATARPSVRQNAPERPAASVRTAPRATQSAPKAAPARTQARQPDATVNSSRSGNSSKSATPARSNTRSSSSNNSGRR
jgi:hypothetical protein